MHSKLFETALGISDPGFVSGVDFDASAKRLTVNIDVVAGNRFPNREIAGGHPVHDTVVKRCRHLNFFQRLLSRSAHAPRLKLPAGRVALVEPEWACKSPWASRCCSRQWC
ncbi:MAG: hypothetical protein VB142_06635 [Burkholderia sp.]